MGRHSKYDYGFYDQGYGGYYGPNSYYNNSRYDDDDNEPSTGSWLGPSLGLMASLGIGGGIGYLLAKNPKINPQLVALQQSKYQHARGTVPQIPGTKQMIQDWKDKNKIDIKDTRHHFHPNNISKTTEFLGNHLIGDKGEIIKLTPDEIEHIKHIQEAIKVPIKNFGEMVRNTYMNKDSAADLASRVDLKKHAESRAKLENVLNLHKKHTDLNELYKQMAAHDKMANYIEALKTAQQQLSRSDLQQGSLEMLAKRMFDDHLKTFPRNSTSTAAGQSFDLMDPTFKQLYPNLDVSAAEHPMAGTNWLSHFGDEEENNKLINALGQRKNSIDQLLANVNQGATEEEKGLPMVERVNSALGAREKAYGDLKMNGLGPDFNEAGLNSVLQKVIADQAKIQNSPYISKLKQKDPGGYTRLYADRTQDDNAHNTVLGPGKIYTHQLMSNRMVDGKADKSKPYRPTFVAKEQLAYGPEAPLYQWGYKPYGDLKKIKKDGPTNTTDFDAESRMDYLANQFAYKPGVEGHGMDYALKNVVHQSMKNYIDNITSVVGRKPFSQRVEDALMLPYSTLHAAKQGGADDAKGNAFNHWHAKNWPDDWNKRFKNTETGTDIGLSGGLDLHAKLESFPNTDKKLWIAKDRRHWMPEDGIAEHIKHKADSTFSGKPLTTTELYQGHVPEGRIEMQKRFDAAAEDLKKYFPDTFNVDAEKLEDATQLGMNFGNIWDAPRHLHIDQVLKYQPTPYIGEGLKV